MPLLKKSISKANAAMAAPESLLNSKSKASPGFPPAGGQDDGESGHQEHCTQEAPGADHRLRPRLSRGGKSPQQGLLCRGAGRETGARQMTYIHTQEGWLYLTAILDLADRKAVGWALSETMEAEVSSVAAWQMAVRNRTVTEALLFHSDRGVQYACREFRGQLEGVPVLQSMSRKGNCWDNAVAEGFFKTMKTDLVYHESFKTMDQTKLAVFDYMEIFDNRERRHSALSYLTPCQYQSLILQKAMAA